MTLAAKLRRAPLRIATGAFILNSGLAKLGADDATSAAVHGMAAGAYPALGKLPPAPFTKGVGAAEVALGGALLLPVVPAGLAGLALTGFAGSLLGMWWRTPGMHAEGSLRPTVQGTAIAKDVWMLSIGSALVVDAALTESPVTGDQSRAELKATLRAEAKGARKAARRNADSARRSARRGARRAARGAARQAARAGDLLPG